MDNETTDTPEGNSGYEWEAQAGPADSLCIMLHGYGADGADMINVAAAMSLYLPTTHFIAPNGPEPCPTAPGFFQWYGFEFGPGYANAAADDLAPRINRYADMQLERLNISPQRLILMGFSQGAGIMLQTALTRTQGASSVLLFTGSLLNRDRLADLIATPRLPPVMLIHGAEDEVIPLDKVMRNAATLEQFGLSVHQHICPGLGHSLNEEGAMAGALFALEQLARS